MLSRAFSPFLYRYIHQFFDLLINSPLVMIHHSELSYFVGFHYSTVVVSPVRISWRPSKIGRCARNIEGYCNIISCDFSWTRGMFGYYFHLYLMLHLINSDQKINVQGSEIYPKLDLDAVKYFHYHQWT